MKLKWIIQVSPRHEFCALCKVCITSGTEYFRATLNEDSPDAGGYDTCARCRNTQPDIPVVRQIV